MNVMQNCLPELQKFLDDDLEHVEDYIWYDRPIVWLMKDKNMMFWLGTAQDADYKSDPKLYTEQEAFFELDQAAVDAIHTDPYLDVLKMAKSVIVSEDKYVPFVGNRPEGWPRAMKVTIDEWLIMNDGFLPRPGIKLLPD
jgi:hypothetical protein